MLERMSHTGTNLNYGQSSGVTPTPSRPTASHASASPTHTTGVHSVNLPLPTPLVLAKKDEALEKAIQEYVKKLSDDDKAAFQDAFYSAPNIVEHLQEMQCNGKIPTTSSLTSRVEKVLQCVKTFMDSLAIFIQHSPEISSLVVGGVKCILTVGTSSTYILANCYSSKIGLIY